MKLVSWVMGTYNGIRRNVILEYELKALSAQNVLRHINSFSLNLKLSLLVGVSNITSENHLRDPSPFVILWILSGSFHLFFPCCCWRGPGFTSSGHLYSAALLPILRDGCV
ncbi:hypothetical protein SDJN03_11521, partial [Cucurbita argyrosperma subsp. sororia]